MDSKTKNEVKRKIITLDGDTDASCAGRLVEKKIRLEGLSCIGCEQKVEKALGKLNGISKIKVSYASNSAFIIYSPEKIDLPEIYRTIKKTGYSVLLSDEDTKEEGSITNALLIGLILVGLYIIVKNTIGFNLFPQVTQNMGYGMLFIAGLFTSIHCIAMCGGINLSQCSGCTQNESNNIYHKLKPSFLYNLGRVTSYTILGGIVGSLGAVFSITLKGKALISIIAGIFMIVMGVNMLGIIPSLRKLMPRIPKNLIGKIDRKRNENGPFIVGLLNGFMPCGPLQAMQLYALGTGNFFAGAFSMFLFSLGTVPLMFAFGAFSSLLNSKFKSQMMKVSAMLVIVLGIVMGNRGFSLAGVSIEDKILSPIGITLEETKPSSQAMMINDLQTVTTILDSGSYEPITVYAGVPLKWTIVVKSGSLNGCNNEIVIPEYGYQKKLELGNNVIEFTPKNTGTITYTCWMGMIRSKIIVE
ncbi:MAG: sulfite exporter TauE/SafE family protein [Clostridiaceae bacterium]